MEITDFNKLCFKRIKAIACILPILVIINAILFGFALKNIILVKFLIEKVPLKQILWYFFLSFHLFLLTWILFFLVSIFIFEIWMKIEESIKGKVVAGRKEFWGIIKVLKTYPLPNLFIFIMCMIMMPITFVILNYFVKKMIMIIK